MNTWLKYGLFFGLGVVVGAAAATFAARNPELIRKGVSTAVGKTIDLKNRAQSVFETAKENFEDLAAEARGSRSEDSGRQA
ncbi:MAG: hypothetical protein LBQ63_03030 [Deltaproteobacteria bacterium]|jgi:gas vesicle protein|nr:hypothetical protein [Deltaproteobacteria bacterium]